jgi:hypothetical protein
MRTGRQEKRGGKAEELELAVLRKNFLALTTICVFEEE